MEDKDIAARFLFLNMAIKNLELDLQHIKNGPFKIKEPYLELLEKAYSTAINERGKLKRLMYNKKINIVSTDRNNKFSYYKFSYNGIEEEQTYYNHVIKKNVKEIIEGLIKEGN
ncbi:MAG TPA: hypothetical protein VFX18_03910 [Candidatus Nitrosocosmicus sp.]|nr:hypothetical protein [Candidatus Nitrosocosmicus sp.]